MNPASPTAPVFSRIASGLAWLAVCMALGCIQIIVTRACGYDFRPVVSYAVYFGLHVYLPGLVVLAFVQRRPVSLALSIALGVPTGFAVEIFSFLLLAACDAKEWLRYVPAIWVALAALWGLQSYAGLVRVRLSARHAGLALAMALLFLGTVLAAAGNLFAESPLISGLPQRPIFHDWVYLVSRAAAIKNLWPLEDPSLAGSSLQYHYFMLVHAASASWVTGTEVSVVLLRLAFVPLGFVLVTQAFVLGRLISRSPWGGVVAALLAVGVGEMGFTPHANESVFLGRFVRWLFVSPTFYFGMIFLGALLLALHRWQTWRRIGVREAVWLGGLAAATAGAKGTVLPVLIPAIGFWALWLWRRDRRLPLRVLVAGAWVSGMFALIYFVMMASWGTAAMAWAPFDIFRISDFWQQHHAAWQQELGGWLPAAVATIVAGLGCSLVVLAGTEGIRMLALPYLLKTRAKNGAGSLVGLLAALLGMSAAMGSLLRLDGDGELYLLLLMRLPGSVLAAAFLMEAGQAWREARARGWAAWSAGAQTRSRFARYGMPVACGVLVAAFFMQISSTARRTRGELHEWLQAAPDQKPDASMQRLHEALLWVRTHTEPDAILVANTWTPASREKDDWEAVDHTLAGVHYYYSALSERRMLVEGPNYLLNAEQARQRMEIAAKVFFERQPYAANVIPESVSYALLDRGVHGGVIPSRAPGTRVFANERIEIYRLPRNRTGGAASAATIISD